MLTDEDFLAVPDVVEPNTIRYMSVDETPRPGLMLEFGTYTGGSAWELCSRMKSGEKLHTFDWFRGLPESWEGHVEREGVFSNNGTVPPLPPNCEVHVGLFADTLPGFMETHPGPVTMVHVDCDLYSSTKTVFDNVASRFVNGTTLLFDEFWGYPAWYWHEAKALWESMREHGYAVEPLARAGRERFLFKVVK